MNEIGEEINENFTIRRNQSIPLAENVEEFLSYPDTSISFNLPESDITGLIEIAEEISILERVVETIRSSAIAKIVRRETPLST